MRSSSASPLQPSLLVDIAINTTSTFPIFQLPLPIPQPPRLCNFQIPPHLVHHPHLYLKRPPQSFLLDTLPILQHSCPILIAQISIIVPKISVIINSPLCPSVPEPRIPTLPPPMSLPIPNKIATNKTEMRFTGASNVIATFLQLHPALAILARTKLPVPPSFQACESSLF